MLFHLGYASTETRPISMAELLDMLGSIRARNAAMNLTGMLLHRDNSFFQVLEGEEETVWRTYEQIALDRRHHRLELLFEGPIEEREFTDWSMGFVQLDDVDVAQLPGFSHFLEQGHNPTQVFHEMSKTQRLMSLFRDMV